jgi:hypothetical protein
VKTVRRDFCCIFPDPAEIRRSIDEAIQDLVRKGLVVDSGQRRWSQRTGRFEIVWESKIVGKTFH